MDDKNVDMDELAKAFDAEPAAKDDEKKEDKKMKQGKKLGAKKWSKILFALGMMVLVAGIAVLAVRFFGKPGKADAEFLVSTGEWVREGEPSVVWKFTEVGKGVLTTDGHTNDYDFIWALENGKIKIETSWLYNMNDEFSYTLDQGGKTFTISNDDKSVEIKFKAKD